MQKDACRRVYGKIFGIDFVEFFEVRLIRSAINIALYNPLQGAAGGFHAPFHLVENDFGLSFERQPFYLASIRIKWR
jgi:hypothetical protein